MGSVVDSDATSYSRSAANSPVSGGLRQANARAKRERDDVSYGLMYSVEAFMLLCCVPIGCLIGRTAIQYMPESDQSNIGRRCDIIPRCSLRR